MSRLGTDSAWKIVCFVSLLCAATAIPSQAQTFTSLVSFNGTNGGDPDGSLVQGLDGNLYGTTSTGGSGCGSGCGTVFRITSGGLLTTLLSFACEAGCCPNGGFPHGALVLAANGGFYGTATEGGAHNQGTVFKITSHGTFTLSHSFGFGQACCPFAGLVQAVDGNLYGTEAGGTSRLNGAIFKMTTGGKFTTLYRFCSENNCADGSVPYAGMIQASNGNLYGTTSRGGASDDGTVFKITPGGVLTTLYSFCSKNDCADGANPYAGLVQAADGNLYGTTSDSGGGTHSGTVFKITPGGTLTTLYSFCSQSNCTDGGGPFGGLVQATDGNLYGTTSMGGGAGCGSGCGTVFKMTLTGVLTILHSFNGTDGMYPYAGLVQATNGSLYGTTSSGGTFNEGTIFKLSVGLGPFVESLPGSGKVGAVVKILGTKLKGTTAVSFNGTAATFTVVSNTEITTTVPAGATTGFVTVTTPSTKLKSNKKFRVTG